MIRLFYYDDVEGGDGVSLPICRGTNRPGDGYDSWGCVTWSGNAQFPSVSSASLWTPTMTILPVSHLNLAAVRTKPH